MSSDRAVKYIRRLLRPRRWVRNALVYFWHADGIRNKAKLVGYSLIHVLRKGGLQTPPASEWTIRLKGLEIHFAPNLGELITYKEIFVSRVYQRLPDFRPTGYAVVFDVGANIGFYTLQAAASLAGGTIYAFEPNPEAYSKLVENVGANRAKNVHLLPYAVGSKQGRVWLRRAERTGLGSVEESPAETGNSRVEVEMVTLDGMVEKHSVTRIDLMKIDVEGHEEAVLAGGERALGMTRRIVMEYHGPEILERVRKFLPDRGFREVLEYRGHVYFVNRRPVGG
ncbi:MAG TPA: FkbM family methyltransferase [Nitrospiria bacterium]|nr:FkbM family methyltransferase [Nitrospiria bacterium]